jgi:hypothetical protein
VYCILYNTNDWLPCLLLAVPLVLQMCGVRRQRLPAILSFVLLPFLVVQRSVLQYWRQEAAGLLWQLLEVECASLFDVLDDNNPNQAVSLSSSVPCGRTEDVHHSLPCGCNEGTDMNSTCHTEQVCPPVLNITHQQRGGGFFHKKTARAAKSRADDHPGWHGVVRFASTNSKSVHAQWQAYVHSKGGFIGTFDELLTAVRVRHFVVMALRQCDGDSSALAHQAVLNAEGAQWMCADTNKFIPASEQEMHNVVHIVQRLGGKLSSDMFVLPQQGAGAGTAPHVSPTFCTHASVGLYCDVQSCCHCGAHALNALLGKQAIPGPDFCVPHM